MVQYYWYHLLVNSINNMNEKRFSRTTDALLMTIGSLVIVGSTMLVTGMVRIEKPLSYSDPSSVALEGSE